MILPLERQRAEASLEMSLSGRIVYPSDPFGPISMADLFTHECKMKMEHGVWVFRWAIVIA